MSTIVLESELYRRIEQVAQEDKRSVGDTLADAVRQYLWELDRRKISEESAVYRQRFPELKGQYLGQYVAMRDGQVIDHDVDFPPLRQRIFQRFGNAPVMIARVENGDDLSLIRRGFRVEKTAT